MSIVTDKEDDMLALQYAHRLPADYPMDRIHERIAARAPLWDDTPGLIFKAFATRTRDVAGRPATVTRRSTSGTTRRQRPT